MRAAVQFRDRNRARPEVIRWYSEHLRRFLLRGRLPLWKPATTPAGNFEPERIWYTNTAEDVRDCLYWLSRAADHESGLFAPGGRRAQSSKAARCAGIVSHEVSVMMAKSNAEIEKQSNSA